MDNELLENIFITNNYSHETRKVNRSVMKKYCEFYGMNLQELLDEAEKDEADNVKWKHRRVKHKLLKYRQFLLDKYSINTVRIHMSVVSKFYRFYDIEINPLPRLNMKAVKKPTPIYYKDLPDKEIIREALAISPPVMKAIILFSCSSGCARAETLSLTIQDYIDALSEYLPNKRMNIYQIIDYLNDNDNVIPTFNLRRIKTNKYYTTYCSPEAVKAINAYILTRTDNVTPESQLFRMYETYFIGYFQRINDELGLGRVGHYSRFRSHMLRKFHASALYNDGMSLDNVNDLQGKAKNKTDQAYFMINPEDLKYEYIKHLPAITINTDVEKLSIKSPEYMQMEKENNEYKQKVERMEANIANIMERLGQEEAK
ncbi:site-specific integrase [Methanobrevibacter woesei]|uniref:tyrosine-type recombinase/integrase n=1 Tax=Methanobrevibacter TaxID=2172 RepID=UPI002353CD9F|nr:site-specific integrase [Methanobrevibacter woesei]